MIHFDGMKAEEQKSESYPQLPEGPYIAQINNVKIDGTEPDQTLILRIEVTEGEYAGYFTKRYQHDSERGGQFAVKYKGDYRLRIPHPNSSSQYPDSDKKRFNDMIFRVEKSNPDFHWDGDENKLKGKAIGINMQKDTYNGNEFTRIGRLETVSEIRAGNVRTMKPRKPREDNQAEAAPTFTPVENVELPF